MIYKIVNNLMSDYIRGTFPNLDQSNCNPQSQPVIRKIRAGTAKYQLAFFQTAYLSGSDLIP